MRDAEADEPPHLVGFGTTSNSDDEPVPLAVFAAAVSFEVVSFVPWPTDQVPVAHTAAMLGFGPAYIISASDDDDDETSVRAVVPSGRYPGPVNARDVRVKALAALERRGGTFGEAIEVADGDWVFIITLAQELRSAAASILSTLARAPKG